MSKSKTLAMISIGCMVMIITLKSDVVLASEQDHPPGHDEHGDEHDEHEGEGVISLSPQEIEEFQIVVEPVRGGVLRREIRLPGEVRINEDRLAHVVPRLSGVVSEVHKTLGDSVHTGEVMAVLDSRELAATKASYLAARERLSLAKSTFRREEDLRNKKISAEKEYLAAKQALAEAQIELRTATQQLRSLGFSKTYIHQLGNEPDAPLTRYEIVVPLDGTVIEKHIVLGEVVKDDAEIFVIADLSSVWVDLSVYQKDLASVRKGQEVVISTGRGTVRAHGRITYIGSIIGESTRTALARVVLPNPDGRWRPGLFVTAYVAVDTSEVPLLIPKTALQIIDDQTHVFVQAEDGFAPAEVKLGKSDALNVEITEGLQKGQFVVTQGAFTLKAELGKGSLSDGHNH